MLCSGNYKIQNHLILSFEVLQSVCVSTDDKSTRIFKNSQENHYHV